MPLLLYSSLPSSSPVTHLHFTAVRVTGPHTCTRMPSLPCPSHWLGWPPITFKSPRRFTRDVEAPFNDAPEPKRRFIPSKHEEKK